MGLKQMGIADDIINLAFGLSLGAIAVAAALAAEHTALQPRSVRSRRAQPPPQPPPFFRQPLRQQMAPEWLARNNQIAPDAADKTNEPGDECTQPTQYSKS